MNYIENPMEILAAHIRLHPEDKRPFDPPFIIAVEEERTLYSLFELDRDDFVGYFAISRDGNGYKIVATVNPYTCE